MPEEEKQIFQSPLNKTLVDKFLFVMNLPEALKNLRKKYVKDLSESGFGKNTIVWSLTNATIPGNLIQSQNIKFAGGSVNISSHTKSPYEPLGIEFIVDNKYLNYSTIYEWVNFIYHEKEGYYNADEITNNIGLNAYSTTLAIIATDEYNNPAIQWSFKYAYPTGTPSIKLDYQTTSEIRCSCQFMFSQMYTKNFSFSNEKS